ncbi:MAG: hypothetical protein R3345_14325, partial [Fulvivirga sp.]|nr:hypothetical protein [Fulvivirga sp.]
EKATTEPSEQEIKAQVVETFNELYKHYEARDLEKFTAFYEDSVIRMGTAGEYQVGKDIFIDNWNDTYDKNDVKLLEYTQPTVLVGENQV